MRFSATRVVAVALVALSSCALVVGLEDKELQPGDGAGDGSSDGTTADVATTDGMGPGAAGPLEVVASGQTSPVGIAVDDLHVYWTSEGTGMVWRRLKTLASPPEVVAKDQFMPDHMLIDEGHVYWNNVNDPLATTDAGGKFNAPLLLRVPRGSAPPPAPEVLYAASERTPGRMALYAGQDDGVLWMTAHFTAAAFYVRRFSREAGAGGPTDTPNGLNSSPATVAVDVGYAYWINQGTHQVWRRAKTFPANNQPPYPEFVGTLPADVVDMAVDAQSLFFATTLGAVVRIDKLPPADASVATADAANGGALNTLGAVSGTPSAIAERDARVYMTTFSAAAGGQVVTIPKAGGAPIVLAVGQNDPRDIAIDVAGGRTTVYWTNYGDGTVMRVAAP